MCACAHVGLQKELRQREDDGIPARSKEDATIGFQRNIPQPEVPEDENKKSNIRAYRRVKRRGNILLEFQ